MITFNAVDCDTRSLEGLQAAAAELQSNLHICMTLVAAAQSQQAAAADAPAQQQPPVQQAGATPAQQQPPVQQVGATPAQQPPAQGTPQNGQGTPLYDACATLFQQAAAMGKSEQVRTLVAGTPLSQMSQEQLQALQGQLQALVAGGA